MALETWYLLSEHYQHVQTFQFSFFACKPLPLPKCQQYEWTLVNFCSFGFALLNVQEDICKECKLRVDIWTTHAFSAHAFGFFLGQSVWLRI